MTGMRPLLWRWAGHRTVGMLHASPAPTNDTGLPAVLLLPGGAQTRIGAGRGLLALARTLAACGLPTLTLDWAGQGDSEGPMQPFDRRGPQIAAARRMLAEATGIHRHVLLGICDGASAALIHAGEEDPAPGLAGLVLVNCWMRDDDLAPPRGWVTGALARRLSGGERMRRDGSLAMPSPSSWRRLWAGLRAARPLRAHGEGALELRLRAAAAACPAPVLWVMARHDPTGRDALIRLRHPRWRRLMRERRHRRLVLAGDDHGLLDPRNRLALAMSIREMFRPVTAAALAGPA